MDKFERRALRYRMDNYEPMPKWRPSEFALGLSIAILCTCIIILIEVIR
jgi:hypothetical protein